MKVYIVVGNTGEYEDRHEWNAFAFTSKEKAEAKLNFLTKKIQELESNAEKISSYGGIAYESREKIEEVMQKLDPRFSMDYTGSWYNITELDVEVDNE